MSIEPWRDSLRAMARGARRRWLLCRLRDLGRKVIVHSGLVDDAIPPAGNIAYHERVVASMGGHAEVQKVMRMYLVPGAAHSSQGRAYTVGANNNSVPLPKLPGNASYSCK